MEEQGEYYKREYMSKKSSQKTIEKRKGLYFPVGELKKTAVVNDRSIYKKSLKNPLKFWEKQAEELKWSKKWTKVFKHHPPAVDKKASKRDEDGMKIKGKVSSRTYFEWFSSGKINITENALDENLEARKNKTALIWEPEPTGETPRKFTYYELFCEVNRFSNVLKKLGVRKGDKVGIYLPMLPEGIIAMLSCARIGAVHSVVFSAFSPTALRVRLQDTAAKVLITADGYYRRGKVIDLKKNADEGVKQTKVKKVIVVKRAGNPINFKKGRDLWWHELVDKADDWAEPVPMDSEDLLFILYTSGSTGKPKGTVHVCGGYTVQAKVTGKWIFDWKEDDIFWSMADIGWITGHTYSCYGPLLNGITYLIFEGAPDWPNSDRWADVIEKYGVTTFYTAPTAIRMFEKYQGKIGSKHQFETLQILGSVGEPIDEAAWMWYFREVGKGRCPIVDTWWQTETGGILITSLPGIGPFKPTFTGLPFPGIRADILDDKGKPVRAGKEGNLVILPPFAPGLLRGVYKNPKKYFDTYWSQYGPKVYFSSDAAQKDKNGLIRIVGRVDDVIKVAGHRVSTGELESAIALLPDITEAAVIGKSDEIRGEVPIAFVISKAKKPKDVVKKEVVLQVRKEIGPIALPKEVYVVDDLPKTRSGKIMRRILRKLFTGEDLGDLSTLANPQSVDKVRKIIGKK